MTTPELCHCGQSVDPERDRGMCTDCDDVRCDAFPGACRPFVCQPAPFACQPDCGGCRGIGSHKKHCRHNPLYSRAHELADLAEDLGDRIGPNDYEAANLCYRAAGVLRQHSKGRDW